MASNKYEVYQKHQILLKIVYHLGGGVMFVSQLAEFLGSKHKTQVWRWLNELLETGLIDKINYHKHSVIKVKAYAIKQILKREKVDSVSMSGLKIKKSAMISQIILKNYKPICKNPEQFLNKVKNHSNLYFPNDYICLLNSIKISLVSNGMNTVSLGDEINRISELTPENIHKIKNFKNLNVYIEKFGLKNENQFTVSFAITDLTSDFNCLSMVKRLNEVFDYYNSILGNSLNVDGRKRINFDFIVYAQDELRVKYIKIQMKKVKQLMTSTVDLSRVSFFVKDLNLTSTLFSGQKIIL